VKFTPTALADVFLVDMDWHSDERGRFGVAWSQAEMQAQGLDAASAQLNVSVTEKARTLRGLHYQVPPAAEAKLVYCLRGAIFEVVADVRPSSPTRGRWFGWQFSAASFRALYIPPGAAHGLMTLADDTLIVYTCSAPHEPVHERGVRWNDPVFGIEWPMGGPEFVSQKDREWPDHRFE
jgi:dTDP-4-dehydrorhamnose 3,5-epimerase